MGNERSMINKNSHTSQSMKAVCLLSGGLDSCVTACIAKNAGYELYALTFDYGQRNSREIKSSFSVASAIGVHEHRIVKLDLSWIGGSALTDVSIDMPERGSAEEIVYNKSIPISYVPMRNTVFLSVGGAYAEAIGADVVFIGANEVDYSHYPDCRSEYFDAVRRVFHMGSKRGVEGAPVGIVTPLIAMSKAEIVRRGMELDAPLDLTWSCYSGGSIACGRCDSCLLRLKGFHEAGAEDPLDYESGKV